MQGAWAYKDLKPLDVARVNLLTRGKESLASKNWMRMSWGVERDGGEGAFGARKRGGRDGQDGVGELREICTSGK